LLLLVLNIFMIISHPLLLSLLLIVLTLLVIINSYNSNNIMWFSFIICLIYLGGVLILFVYVSSFLPNFKVSTFYLGSFFFFWLINIFIFFNEINLNYFVTLEFLTISDFNLIFSRNKIIFLFFSIFYLTFVLLISVYYSSINKIPLRRVS
jgi:NADH-ubiquinone oxidoreductase chain 6